MKKLTLFFLISISSAPLCANDALTQNIVSEIFKWGASVVSNNANLAIKDNDADSNIDSVLGKNFESMSTCKSWDPYTRTEREVSSMTKTSFDNVRVSERYYDVARFGIKAFGFPVVKVEFFGNVNTGGVGFAVLVNAKVNDISRVAKSNKPAPYSFAVQNEGQNITRIVCALGYED